MSGENPAPGAVATTADPPPRILVIGCGNLLRGDDAAGPELVRRLTSRELPAGVRCLDVGTGGIDVAFGMRGVPEVILVDACRSESPPGSLFELPGAELDRLPSPSGLSLHDLRWNDVLACGRWLFGAEPPGRVTAFLIEGATFEAGAGLSPAVERAIDVLAERLLARLAAAARGSEATATGPDSGA